MTIIIEVCHPVTDTPVMWTWRASIGSLLVLVACATPDDDPTAPFRGTWRYEAGSMLAIECPGNPTVMDLTNMQLQIGSSTSADLQIAGEDSRCMPILFELRDRIATAVNAGCTYDMLGSGCAGWRRSVSYESFTLTLDATETTLADDRRSTVTIYPSCGEPTTCTRVLVGTATKL